MNKRFIFTLFYILLHFLAFSQNELVDNVVGYTSIQHSLIMEDEREITIFLPEDYSTSDSRYPVLYVLDGQRYFLHAVSLQKSFVDFKQCPPFIVIGISKKKEDRNKNYSTNSNKYRNYIKTELVPYVDSKFRTTNERMLFGWAYGGSFVVETMIFEPELFAASIAASPFPLQKLVGKLDSFLIGKPSFDKSLYFSSESNEGAIRAGTRALSKLLQENAPTTFRWTFHELEDEEHRSTPYTSLYRGIATHFSYYPELQFNSLEDFTKAGGLENVYEYYQKRASKYGFSAELSDWTMFSLTRNAIRANNYEQFHKLFNEFNKTELITRLRLSRASSIAAFYQENKQYDQALAVYLTLADTHPNSELPLMRLAELYRVLNQNEKATEYYNKAKEISESRSK